MQDLIKKFVSEFETLELRNPPIRIKINGKFVRMRSGKSGWRTIGHAKAAIKGSVGYLVKEVTEGAGNYREREKKWTEFIDELVKIGIIEFV